MCSCVCCMVFVLLSYVLLFVSAKHGFSFQTLPVIWLCLFMWFQLIFKDTSHTYVVSTLLDASIMMAPGMLFVCLSYPQLPKVYRLDYMSL